MPGFKNWVTFAFEHVLAGDGRGRVRSKNSSYRCVPHTVLLVYTCLCNATDLSGNGLFAVFESWTRQGMGVLSSIQRRAMKMFADADRRSPRAIDLIYRLAIMLCFVVLKIPQFSCRNSCLEMFYNFLNDERMLLATSQITIPSRIHAKVLQRSSSLSRHLTGVGIGMVVMTGVVSVYYNVILAWALLYLAMSFKDPIPWDNCNNVWNTPGCYMRSRTSDSSGIHPNKTNVTTTPIYQFASTIPTTLDNFTSDILGHDLTNLNLTHFNETMRKSPTEEFWERYVLGITEGVSHPGTIRWQLLLCLLAAWIIVFLCLIKGIKSSGKVVYVAATVPYVLLSILLIRGLLLPGAVDGILFYIVPRWENLLEISVWSDAAVQVFYSAGIGWGGIATLASYNNFHNNCYRDAIFLPIIDALTSLFAGFVIFVTLGNMSYETGVAVGEVVDQGPGIAFMVYPEAVSRLPVPQLWSVIFFLTLFAVGIDSQFVHVQTITSALFDKFPHQLMPHRMVTTGLVCLVLFVLGLPCITQGGVYVLQILDWYCASVCVMLLALSEVLALAWVYDVGLTPPVKAGIEFQEAPPIPPSNLKERKKDAHLREDNKLLS
ncbi:hypothetical protein ScPMuIL_008341 [Solemya velum]